eukprot:15450608-Alexandrium_andersonii.AAC.1
MACARCARAREHTEHKPWTDLGAPGRAHGAAPGRTLGAARRQRAQACAGPTGTRTSTHARARRELDRRTQGAPGRTRSAAPGRTARVQPEGRAAEAHRLTREGGAWTARRTGERSEEPAGGNT